MGYKNVTRADVAKRAGVSETVVSYVVNDNRYVDSEKRRRVLEAIAELGYRPNCIARALKGKNSNHIIFLADQITNEHFSQIISEMDKYAYDMGYLISLCATRNNEDFVSRIISRRYDGIMISSTSFYEEYIRQFIAARIPVVLLANRDYSGIEGAGKIDTGLYDAARECVRFLASKGRRHILYIDRFSARGNFSTMADLRLRGFVEAMQENGLPLDERNIITGCSCEEEVAANVKKRIMHGFSADAVFGRNDRLACIGMRAAEELGMKIPRDVSVIGFDNSILSQYTRPRITTVEMQRGEIGKAAVKMLYRMIEKKSAPEKISFPARLIEREST